MSKTKIEWTDASWSPVVGCTKVSEGCQNCYAERMAIRLNGIFAARGDDDNWARMTNILKWDYSEPEVYEFGRATGWNGQVELFVNRLDQPLHWRKPRRIFVCSMGDLFHESVPFEFIEKVFRVIDKCPQHTFQLLTKRPDTALEYTQYMIPHLNELQGTKITAWYWPENIWLGVSCENQKAADERIPILLQIPAAVRFVSIEPMLEAVDLKFFEGHDVKQNSIITGKPCIANLDTGMMINWVIIGCESGLKRRPCKLEWVRDLVNQCKAAGIPVFVKQLSINGKVSHNMKEWPEWAQVRQMPEGE